MTLRADLVSEGGGHRVSFGLRIEGIAEMFVTDPWRADGESLNWELGDNDEQYGVDGLEYADDYALEERIDWQTATLDAATLTVRVYNRDGKKPQLNAAADRVFGGRAPTKRTWLAAPLSATDTTVTVSSTEGWDGADKFHIGREWIQAGGISGNDFIDCERGIGGTLAVTHNYEAERPESIEVTDVPVAVEQRRAQLYLFLNDNASNTGEIIWRGKVAAIDQTDDGLGWVIELDHVSSYLDQEIGETLGPFALDGYYFPDEAPFVMHVREWSQASPIGFAVAYVCEISITGRIGTRDDLVQAINDQLQPTSANSAWSATPVNTGYSAKIGNGNQLVVQFRTEGGEAGNPKWVDCDGPQQFPGVPDGFAQMTDEDGAAITLIAGVGLAVTYSLTSHGGGTGRFERDEFPDAYTAILPRSLDLIPEDGAAATHPPNRIYHAGTANADSVTEIAGPAGHGVGDRRAGVFFSVLDDGAGYLTVGRRPGDPRVSTGMPVIYFGWSDAPVEFTPVLAFEKQRFDTWLRTLADATPDSGTSGVTPFLPSSEFDWTDIERVVLAAGGDSYAKEWRIYKSGSLREMVTPELQAMGLCWATTAAGLITVVPITVASGAVATEVTVAESTNGPAQTPTIKMTPDGVINIVEVRGGWNPETEEYDRLIGAAEMPSSWEHFGQRRLTIEPKGAELQTSFSDIDFRARVARSLCHIYAFPYGVVMLAQCPGLLLADALLGQNVSITDARIVWNGTRGVVDVRGQIVGRRVSWNMGNVDLWVMLTEWNATAYSPAAKLHQTTPMGGTGNKRLTMRNEAVYGPSDLADYRRFAAGDKIMIRRIDYATALVEEANTIESIDTTNHYIYLQDSPAVDYNAAGSRWIMEYDTRDVCEGGVNSAAQLAYAFIADSAMTLDGDPAQVWAA